MAKIAVIYWSGTGNTQSMAESVLEGLKAGGADASLFTVSEFGSRLHSAAPQWVPKNLNRMNLSPSLLQ